MPTFDRMAIEEWRRSSRVSRFITPETSHTLGQGEPTIPQNENPDADSNHISSNSNGGIRRSTQASTDEEGLGLAGANQQQNENGHCSTRGDEQSSEDKIKNRKERKVKYKSSNSNGGIRRSTQASSDEDGSTGANQQSSEDGQLSTSGDEQSNEDKIKKRNERRVIKNRNALKVKVFDSMTSVLAILSSVSAVIFGYQYIGECPANLYMPYMVYIIGLLSFCTMGHILEKTHSLPSEVVTKNFDCLGQNERKVIEWLFWLFVCLWTCESGCFFCMSYNVSFDSSADNYCDHSFYTFTIIMNIFAFVSSIIGLALLYDRSNKFFTLLERGVANIPPGALEWMLFDSSSDSE